MLATALDLEALSQTTDREPLYSRQLLDEALVLLKDRVQDSEIGVSDQTIVSVALFAALEHDRGDMRALNMHLEGLKRMVHIRGGLNALRCANALAANVVFCPENIQALYGIGALLVSTRSHLCPHPALLHSRATVTAGTDDERSTYNARSSAELSVGCCIAYIHAAERLLPFAILNDCRPGSRPEAVTHSSYTNWTGATGPAALVTCCRRSIQPLHARAIVVRRSSRRSGNRSRSE
ncbi:hypothetical protein M8818_001969 [Zalaria obscura]|uniref:Uncharacterized protein n=1 Tax=Zalaria obscura TaxID=2024903 RepID=A0ACC3SKK4_9PEZI